MAIFFGTLIVELEITDSLTLKDKRHVVKSMLDRIRGRFNVAAAEVEQLNSVRHATLAVAAVGNERGFVHEILSKVQEAMDNDPRTLVLDFQTEVS